MLDPGRLGLHPATGAASSSSSDGQQQQQGQPAMPALTGRQRRALDTLARLARRGAVRIHTRPGDVLVFNNYALLHAREAYQDGEEDDGSSDDDKGGVEDTNHHQHVDHHRHHHHEKSGGGPRRHLVRLWPRNPAHSWSIPDSMRALWEPAHGGSIGRFLPRRYPVVPEREYRVPKYTSGSAAWAVEDADEEDGV